MVTPAPRKLIDELFAAVAELSRITSAIAKAGETDSVLRELADWSSWTESISITLRSERSD